jgi:DNA-binding transcriptional LysR family regulator
MVMPMNRNHLALFHAVAEAGSVSAGAEQLHISQPAVSKQLGELEEMLEMRLFDRLPRGVRLTEAGKLLANYARKITILENDADHALAELRGLKRGRLFIGASTTIGGYLLPNVLIRFHQTHPGIDVTVETGNTAVIQAALLEGRLELGFTEGDRGPEDLETTVFHKDELVVIAPTGHRLLAKEGGITARELSREPLIMREIGSGTREVIEAAFKRKKIALKPAMSLGSTEAIKRVVGGGMGLAIVSRLAVAAELHSYLLGMIPLADLKIMRPLHQQHLRSRTLGPTAEAFLRMIKQS